MRTAYPNHNRNFYYRNPTVYPGRYLEPFGYCGISKALRASYTRSQRHRISALSVLVRSDSAKPFQEWSWEEKLAQAEPRGHRKHNPESEIDAHKDESRKQWSRRKDSELSWPKQISSAED